MDDRFRNIFRKANSFIEEGKVIEFCEAILDLFNKYDCNCFLQGQSDNEFEKQMQFMDEFKSDNLTYRVVKGFYYDKIKLQEKAYEVLSSVIQNDKTNDFAYHFRSYIKKEINPNREDDAKNAIILKTSARYYKRLADILDEDGIGSELAKHYYNVAIRLNNSFACAYLNRGIISFNLKDYNSASEDFKKNIEIEKTERGYIALMRSLIGEKKYSEAESIYSIGYKHLSSLNQCLYQGIFHSYSKNYDESIRQLRYCLNIDPAHEYAKELLAYCEKMEIKTALSDARTAFINGSKGRAQRKYEVCIENDIELTEQDINNYFNAKVDPINISNQLYWSVSALKNFPMSHYLSCPEIFYNLDSRDILESEDFKIFYSNSVLDSGKYKGSVISDIIASDPNYIFGGVTSNVHFILAKSLFYDKRLITNKLYKYALAANLIKLHIIEKWKLKTIENQPYRVIDYSEDDPKQYKRDTFDALSDGQLGDYDDYDGDIDDVSDWSGR